MSTRIPPDDDQPLVAVGKQAIGSAVKAGRLRLGWPQRWLATQAGVSQPIISRLESGRLNGIRWQTLARIVGVLQLGRGFHLPDLLNVANWPTRKEPPE
jgi:transcriptional regulator with XRE-family HTH domain